jgi:hypothetical protein
MVPMVMAVNVVFLFIGITLGKYSERVKWNKLIQEGKLPKPRGSV